MRPLTREQARAPKREAEPVTLPEYSAPLLVAKPSASLMLRLRERKVDLASEEAIAAMMADMLVDEDGSRMFDASGVTTFLDGISADSLKTISEKCFEMFAKKSGAPGN